MMSQVWPCLYVANSQLWWIYHLYFLVVYMLNVGNLKIGKAYLRTLFFSNHYKFII